jgi:small membrane protein
MSFGPTLVIQLLLIAGVLVIAAWMFFRRGARQLAIRRMAVIAFAVFAVLTIVFPTALTRVANIVGVGRGADLLLYLLVLFTLGFFVLQEGRARAAEKRWTALARQLALDDAEQPAAYRSRIGVTPPGAVGETGAEGPRVP